MAPSSSADNLLSLYNCVLKQRGVKREDQLVKKAGLNVKHHKYDGNNAKNNNNNNQTLHPTNNLFSSFEHYDVMMAVLTSQGLFLDWDMMDWML